MVRRNKQMFTTASCSLQLSFLLSLGASHLLLLNNNNFFGRLPKFRWDVIWLPFGPLGASAICLYVDHLLTESSEEVRKLRGYMYTSKAS
ncbi:hypothetical protein AAZX31_05G209600 [Glycine max]